MTDVTGWNPCCVPGAVYYSVLGGGSCAGFRVAVVVPGVGGLCEPGCAPWRKDESWARVTQKMRPGNPDLLHGLRL